MGKIIIDEEKLLEGIQEVVGGIFYNDRSEIVPPFEHLAEYYLDEMAQELMDDLMGKIKEISEAESE